MVIERIKFRNIADPAMDKVHCWYFDKRNLQVVDVRVFKTTGSYKLILSIYLWKQK